jgi:hypothetical protein
MRKSEDKDSGEFPILSHTLKTTNRVNQVIYQSTTQSTQLKAQWLASTRSYLATRRVLSRVCVLVDSTRGIGADDKSLLHFLSLKRVPHQVRKVAQSVWWW